jgi:thiamine-monophosphate kinase
MGRAASGYIFYRTGYRPDLGINMMLGISARIREAQIMSEYGAKFMMDLSDGVFASISQMKSDYGIGFKIVENELKPDRNVAKAIH